MSVPSSISALIEQIDRNLTQIELEASEGLNLCRAILDRFPNNARLTQFFAYFSSAIMFAELERRRITSIVQNFSGLDAPTEEQIQEIGEDLAEELGKSIETRLFTNNLKQRMEELS